jgi:NADH-quinone oxidoreductase subunit H
MTSPSCTGALAGSVVTGSRYIAPFAGISTPDARPVYKSETMKRLGTLAPVLLVLVIAWLAWGGSCTRELGPQLVNVTDVVPRAVELGDRVVLVGEGFPAGKPARVTFRGTLHRPGERPETGAEIVTSATVLGPDQAELAFTEPVQALFCGAGDRAAHTTFDGDVEVAFAAAAPGAPPIAGTLRRVTLDVRPGAVPSDAAQEGARAAGWMGLRGTASSAGFAVEAVDHGSRAEGAGLQAGDVITAFDGLRVGAASDMVPAPGEREVAVAIRRAGVDATRTMAVDGWRRAAPAELLGAALIVLAALLLVVLLASPLPAIVAAGVQRVASRMRASRDVAVRRGSPARHAADASLRAALADALPLPGAAALVDAMALALLLAMPLGQYLVAARLDVGLLFAVAATSLATAALVGSGSAWRGVRAAAHVAWQHVPAAIAVAAVVVTTGSLRVQEIARDQAGCPWDWLAFRSPAMLVALALLLSCARIDPGPSAAAAPAGLAAFTEAAAPAGPARTGLAVACRAHRMLVSGLAALLFLGGWLLPGVPAAVQAAHPTLQVAGAALLLAKTWLIVLLLAWARRVVPAGGLAERSRAVALRGAPLALATALAAAAWTWWSPAHAAQLLVSGSLVVAVAAAAAALANRLRHGMLAPAADGRLSPFV